MAAQAVDFTISGHVNRALVVVDSDDNDSSKAEVVNNTSSGTRIRWKGSSEMMDGNSVGIHVSYQETSDGSLGLRHANVHYAGEFGKMTIGQGSEAGDGSAYEGNVRTIGIGHGQEKGSAFTLGDYFGSLDAGTRTNMIRYDTPAIGPVGAAVSVGNNDRISLAAKLSTEFSGSSFNAMLASLQEKGNPETIGASFGVSMANGLGISGAWAKGKDHKMGAKDAMSVNIDNSDYNAFWGSADTDGDGLVSREESAAALEPYGGNLEGLLTGPGKNQAIRGCGAMGAQGRCIDVVYKAAKPANVVDPSYFQAAVSYSFGNSKVSASWYRSEDMVAEGSEGTAFGVGVNHDLPKVGAQVYAAVQNYDVEKMKGGKSVDETVFVVGTRVMF